MENILESLLCEVCKENNFVSVLELGQHHLCDDLVPIGSDRICQQYPIEILFCSTCFTAQQRFFPPKEALFPSSYHYRSRFTLDVLKGMSSLVEACEARLGNLQNKVALDIGCNDGSLLNFFKAKGCKTIGIEPTSASLEAKTNGHSIYKDYLSKATAHDIIEKNGHPDIITFTNVFAHIENLQDVLAILKNLMMPSTLLVIENHYLGAILKKAQFDTFYHEHLRTYSLQSFQHIANSLGLSLLDADFPSRYGGNIRVFLGNDSSLNIKMTLNLGATLQQEQQFFTAFKELQQNISLWKKNKSTLIQKTIATHGKLVAKSFPGRAAILIKLLELDESSITAAYEKPGSFKIGHYIPGTRIPILSDELLFSIKPTQPILNLAWHISEEIRGYLAKHDFKQTIIDIVSEQDFLPVDCRSIA